MKFICEYELERNSSSSVDDEKIIFCLKRLSQEKNKEIILKIEKEDEYISNELSRWLELDFSNAVEVHNYVWSKLGGTVGKAEKLNEKNIEILMSVLSE